MDDATADVGMYLMLGAFRQSWVPSLAIRKGEWRGKSGKSGSSLVNLLVTL